MSEVRCVLKIEATVGESPTWVPEESAIYWSDILGKTLHRFDPGSGGNESWEMPWPVGSFALKAPGEFILAHSQGFSAYQHPSGATTAICDPEADKPNNRFNDGRCGPDGCFWAGTMDETRKAADGALYRLTPDGRAEKKASGVWVSNGLAWSPGGETMYHSDSRVGTVWQYDFDKKTGNLSNRRVFIQLTEEQGRPDGATVDAQGYYWSACFLGGRVLRISPQGKIVQEIHLPVSNPTMPVFGGESLERLFVTTARQGLSESEIAAQPLAGSIFELEVDVKGLVEPRVGG